MSIRLDEISEKQRYSDFDSHGLTKLPNATGLDFLDLDESEPVPKKKKYDSEGNEIEDKPISLLPLSPLEVPAQLPLSKLGGMPVSRYYKDDNCNTHSVVKSIEKLPAGAGKIIRFKNPAIVTNLKVKGVGEVVGRYTLSTFNLLEPALKEVLNEDFFFRNLLVLHFVCPFSSRLVLRATR